MLMSVTERFTEIATMKCLGALDRSVMLMFVIEAAIVGAVGGLVGVVAGLGLAGLRAWVEFGPLLGLASGSASQLMLATAASIGIGVALAMLAALGPAWTAARLLPMEAMRVE